MPGAASRKLGRLAARLRCVGVLRSWWLWSLVATVGLLALVVVAPRLEGGNGDDFGARAPDASQACAVLQAWRPGSAAGQWWHDPRADEVTRDASRDPYFERAFAGWVGDASTGMASPAALAGDAAEINDQCAATGVLHAVPVQG